MTNRGQFSQLLAAGLQVMGWDILEEWPEEYSDWIDVQTSDGAYEEDQVMAGMGLPRLKQEGSPLVYDDPIQGGSVRYINSTYAYGWICTKEMLADDKYNKIRAIPKELLPGMRYLVEQTAAGVLNNGFVTVKTADGVALFNTAHPLLGPQGGTQSNQHATNADLSQTALQDLFIIAENFVNERGLKRYVKPTDLEIPPELQWVAKRVLNSEYEPGSGNNDVNTVQGIVTPHVRHFFTSTTAFFLRSQSHNYLKFYWRQKPQTDAADDFDTKGQKHSIDARFSAGATHYAGWFGSTGLGS